MVGSAASRRLRQPGLSQQRRRGRLPPAERLEDLHRMAAAAEREDGVAEAPAGRRYRFRIVETGILERRERVGRQHLGPLVAVVAGGIAAREDVAEAAEEA